MRFITQFDNLKDATLFHRFLEKEKVMHTVEEARGEGKQILYLFWVQEEDQKEKALALAEAFLKSGGNITLESSSEKTTPSKMPPPLPPMKPKTYKAYLTRATIFLCVLIFMFSSAQKWYEKGVYFVYPTLTPIESALLFDFPYALLLSNELNEKYGSEEVQNVKELNPQGQKLYQEIKDHPIFMGYYNEIVLQRPSGGKLFGKILQGQVWRFVTPIFLHASVLHILFNMLWVWFLGRLIEDNLQKSKYILLILIIAIISNTLQYLMSGPIFLGYSGVVFGFGGFIWMRKIKAPWELYPIDRFALILLGIFILIIVVFQIVAFFLQISHIISSDIPVGNTAHIVGAFVGLLCGRMKFFERKL